MYYQFNCNTNNSCRTFAYFFTVNDDSGAMVSGSSYQLTNRCGTVATGCSNSGGVTVFYGLSQGVYTLKQCATPDGYEADEVEHTVVVDRCCNVTIDGKALGEFFVRLTPIPVPEPTPDIVLTGARSISGVGEPGATITITLPNGSKLTAVVGEDGAWAVRVPDDVSLTAAQTVDIKQTMNGNDSPTVTMTVTDP